MITEKRQYEDYKYFLQDTGYIYIGTRYSLQEIIQVEDIVFKFRKVVAESIIPLEGVSREDTLETHLYYLEPDSFAVQIYKQMKARVKVGLIVEKKRPFKGLRKEYTTEFWTIDQLVALSPQQKEEKGLVVSELKISKLALATV